MSSSTDHEVCRKERAEAPPALFQNGKIVLQTHHIGWIITGCFAIVATVISFWLVDKHLQWYTNKREQRYIVRILFLVPLYAIISFASYLWWNHATPIILIRDCYESTVLTAFFYLLLMYLSPDPEEQRRIFMKQGMSRQNDIERIKKGEPVQRWVFPLGFIKWKPADGLYFLQLMKWGILQYCVLRPLTTLSAVILDYIGLYCESSWGLGWGHIYITIIVSLSVTVAMFCLIQLYIAVSKELARHKPLLKLFAIKAVVFLTFWQATFLSVLSLFGVVKDTQYMTAEDINIGIGALLETFEMMLFALLHVWAFTYKVYRAPYGPKLDFNPPERTPRLKSLGHTMDFRETFREMWVGFVYMWHKFRGKEPVIDRGAIRAKHFEGIFGKPRPTQHQRYHDDDASDDDNIDLKQPRLPKVQVEITERVEVDIEGEKQWLGTGDNYGYGLKFWRKDRSEGLEEQIEKELEKRGYTLRSVDDTDLQQPKHPKQKSWWRSMYNRISQSGHDDPHQIESANAPLQHTPSRKRISKRSQRRNSFKDEDVDRKLLVNVDVKPADFDLDEQPTPSLIVRKNRRGLRRSVDRWRQSVEPQLGNEDIDTLMPLPVPAQGYVGYSRTDEHRRRRGRDRERLATLAGTSSSPAFAVINDPREQEPLESPSSECRLEVMFKGAVDDPPLGLNQAPTNTTQSEISSAEGYRLAKPTPATHLIPSQPSIIPTDQLGMAKRICTTRYRLTDGGVHVPMTADVIDVIGNRIIEERKSEVKDYGGGGGGGVSMSTSPIRTAHKRESAISRIHNHSPDIYAFSSPLPGNQFPITPTRQLAQQPLQETEPSMSPTPLPLSPSPRPTAVLQRRSAQYYYNHSSTSFSDSRKQPSHPSPKIEFLYPYLDPPPMFPTGHANHGRRQPRNTSRQAHHYRPYHHHHHHHHHHQSADTEYNNPNVAERAAGYSQQQLEPSILTPTTIQSNLSCRDGDYDSYVPSTSVMFSPRTVASPSMDRAVVDDGLSRYPAARVLDSPGIAYPTSRTSRRYS